MEKKYKEWVTCLVIIPCFKKKKKNLIFSFYFMLSVGQPNIILRLKKVGVIKFVDSVTLKILV